MNPDEAGIFGRMLKKHTLIVVLIYISNSFLFTYQRGARSKEACKLGAEETSCLITQCQKTDRVKVERLWKTTF
jgi:hypothetical protein